MLAEIFMLRLEAAARAAKKATTRSRFVPITLPLRRRPNRAAAARLPSAPRPGRDFSLAVDALWSFGAVASAIGVKEQTFGAE
jgi:hypothetical protein